MTEFYQAAPEGYRVSEKSLCLTGRLMAVKYKDMGFFRAVVQKNVAETEKLVTVQHLDYGTKENVNVEDLFFLHRRFLISCMANFGDLCEIISHCFNYSYIIF